MKKIFRSILGQTASKGILTICIFLFLSCAKSNTANLAPEVPNNTVKPRTGKIKLAYGLEPSQFGELYLPQKNGPCPVVVIIHGGCWLSVFDLHLMGKLSDSLAANGFAVWNLEYRRIGENGGGWPGTFLDIGAGISHLREIQDDFNLDLESVALMGHSAGGHLALWYGGQSLVPEGSPIKISDPLPLKGIISLAGIVDLETYLAPSGCGSNVDKLMDGTPAQVPDRYFQASPIFLLPLCVPQVLITGENDSTVPVSHILPYFNAAQSAGDDILSILVEDIGHLDVIDPGTAVFPIILNNLEILIEE